jgi:hypothetical protein
LTSANSEIASRDPEGIVPPRINRVQLALEAYCDCAKDGLDKRWKAVELEIYDPEKYEVIFGLLSRQATLSIQLADNFSIWNGHIAPLILRCMIDAHINLKWILDDLENRTRLYVLHGLGQEKLNIENLKERVKEGNEEHKMVSAREDWLERERAGYLTDVNLGSWSGKNVRDMANECGCEDLYKFGYTGFSGGVHNIWPHIAIYNLETCRNPLHKNHRVPKIYDIEPDFDYPYRSSKYLAKSYRAVDEALGLKVNTFDPEDFFINTMNGLNSDKP